MTGTRAARKHLALLALCGILVPGASALAQHGDKGMAAPYRNDPGLHPGARYVSVVGGGSWSNRVGPRFSSIPTQAYALTTLRSSYVVERRGPFAMAFYLELVPAIVVTGVPRSHVGTYWIAPAGPTRQVVVWDAPAPVYGAGINPVGLELFAVVARRASIFISSSAGIAWFTRDMPVPESRKRNFSGDLGGGVRIAFDTHAIIIGAKFHHMSNANTGRQNPGLDGNVVYVGFARSR